MNLKDLKSVISGGTILIAVILYLIFADPKDEAEKNPATTNSTEQTAETKITTDYAMKATGKQLQEVTYVSANDGDTFTVNVNGEKKKVRLLMIDTPEMNYNKGEPMPYAEQAKDYTITKLKNAGKIELLLDKGPETDNYDRLLGYVFVDGELLQEKLVTEGLAAMRYVNAPNNSLEQEIRDAQKKAEAAKLNIWSIDGYFENNRFNEDVQ